MRQTRVLFVLLFRLCVSFVCAVSRNFEFEIVIFDWEVD